MSETKRPKRPNSHHLRLGEDQNLTASEAKKRLLEFIRDGLSVEEACRLTNKSTKTFYYYTKSDPDFSRDLKLIRALKSRKGEILEEDRNVSFEDFREKYLGQKTFAHQRNMIDMIESAKPSWLHDSMIFEEGLPQYVLVNMPPEHCATVDTPVFTDRGWTTIGDIEIGDKLLGLEGEMWPVYETWNPDSEVETYKVTFNTGDEIVTDADHKWLVWDYFKNTQSIKTTFELLNSDKKYKVKVNSALILDDANLPLDPYILGYWLGDGDSNGYRIATSKEDLNDLTANLELSGFKYKATIQKGGYSVYVYGMTKALRSLDLIKNKHIPKEYYLSSHKQRLALLQGLMDSDGTITAKDGRAKWVQHNRPDLAKDVYRLIASLGYQPRLKHYVSNSGFKKGQDVYEVYFMPREESVFRLFRKSIKQKSNGSYTKTDYRIIKSVEPVGLNKVKCITTTAPNNLFAIGDAMIPTHNAKSMTVSIDYVTYRICTDPNVRIKLVSKTQQMAKEFLYAVKQRLTSHQYIELQRRYAPADGFKATADKWTADSIYIERDSGEKDPTLQALGIGGQIYGARADLIILDDCVTLANAGEYEKQIRWIQQEVLTRIGPTGKLLVVGTRVNPVDLYREIRNPDRYPDGKSPWTYLAMPAVLEFDEDYNNWVTLWPKSDQPWANDPSECDSSGLYPRWDGRYLRQRRGVLDAKTWAMVYQQQDVESEAIFAPELVRASANGMRGCGPLIPGAPGYPPSTNGFYTVCAMDPAMSGDTFTVALTGDRNSKKRYLLDANRITAPTPQRIREIIFQYTERYKPAVWVIEKNAFQLFLTQDEEINKFLQSRGIRLVQHYTGKNKLDLEYGVASLAQLFGTFGPDGKPAKNNLIELPRAESEGVKALIEQLITWSPDTKNKQDGPMALWMAEIQLRDYINQSGAFGQTFVRNPFATPIDLERRRVVNLEEYAEKQRLANAGWF